jgi:hypothetical protein
MEYSRYAPASLATHDKMVEEHKKNLEEESAGTGKGGKKKKN